MGIGDGQNAVLLIGFESLVEEIISASHKVCLKICEKYGG